MSVVPVDPRAALTNLNVGELCEAWGVPKRLRSPLRPVIAPLVYPFANALAQADQRIGEAGLRAGMALLLQRYSRGLRLHYEAEIPATGPLVVVANHPGLLDAPALITALARDDIFIVVRERALFDGLPQLRRHLLILSASATRGWQNVKAMTEVLRSGHCLLLFPAGVIEPDPAWENADEALQRWSAAPVMLARRVPEAITLPAVISGVVNPLSRRHLLTRWRHQPAQRAWLAATLQVICQRYHDVTVSVRLARPLHSQQVTALALQRQMQRLYH